MAYWLAKTEPEEYSWEDLKRDKNALWDGVRNYAARNNLSSMEVGDEILIYYSGKKKAVIGVAELAETAFPDPKDNTGTWVAVRIKARYKLNRPVTLKEIKEHPLLSNMVLVKNSRLSLQPVTEEEFEILTEMAK
jgi:predicted RNA-binding protein with PUA-like domain